MLRGDHLNLLPTAAVARGLPASLLEDEGAREALWRGLARHGHIHGNRDGAVLVPAVGGAAGSGGEGSLTAATCDLVVNYVPAAMRAALDGVGRVAGVALRFEPLEP
jgi:hypothetical protein